MRLATITLSALLLLAACTGPRPITDDRTGTDSQVRFSVVGDMPYSGEEDALLTGPEGAIAEAIRADDPPVLIHLGDFKRGSATCSDSLFVARREQMFNLNPFRTVFTPGDNDWTDCDREGMSVRFDELERLEFLRDLFFQGEGAKLTRDIPGLVRQDGFVENAMWQMKGLVFGTLHIPGTNNGRDEILQSDVDKALDEADQRDRFNEVWVDRLFDTARLAQALVILFQADMYRPDLAKPNRVCTADHRTDCDGFKRLRDHLERRAALYEKPVLLVHGDTNAYCFHKPAEGLVNTLWRLNAPGDFKYIDAARITFDPGTIAAPFVVSGLLDSTAPPSVCDYSR